jgi:2-oxoglutarate ferredoxin oxidoreductase subunit delta
MAKDKKQYIIHIDEDFCKGCNICVEMCATDVFTISTQINSKGYYVPVPTYAERCGGCMICELSCPELAVILEVISIAEENK